MSAWRSLHGSDARLELVADDSLVRVLGPDARSFLALKRQGGIRTEFVADDEILRLARDDDLHVITRDHYIDHRGAHPWIARSPHRFHAWDTVEGVVRLTPLGIRTRSAQDVSQAREVKVLRYSAKLDAKNQAHRKILQTRWGCENTSCRRPPSGRASCSPGPACHRRAPRSAPPAPGPWSRSGRGPRCTRSWWPTPSR